MTTVSASERSRPSYIDYDTAEEKASLKQSAVDIYNRITGEKKTVDDLGTAQLTEDLLFASIVYDNLKATKPKVAERLMRTLKEKFDKKTERNEAQPLLRTVRDVLKCAVQEGRMNPTESERLMRSAFGRAQLDGKETRLSRRVQDVRAGDLTKSNIDETLAKVGDNSAASKREFKAFTNRIERHRWLGPKLARDQRAALGKVFSAVNEVKPEAPKPEAPKPESPPVAAPPSKEESTPVDRKPISIDSTGPNEMVIQPVSIKDGNLILALPTRYSEDTIGVTLENRTTHERYELRDSGNGSDGRAHYRGDKPGSSFQGDFTIVLKFRDGTTLPISVGKLDQVYHQAYRM